MIHICWSRSNKELLLVGASSWVHSILALVRGSVLLLHLHVAVFILLIRMCKRGTHRLVIPRRLLVWKAALCSWGVRQWQLVVMVIGLPRLALYCLHVAACGEAIDIQALSIFGLLSIVSHFDIDCGTLLIFVEKCIHLVLLGVLCIWAMMCRGAFSSNVGRRLLVALVIAEGWELLHIQRLV